MDVVRSEEITCLNKPLFSLFSFARRRISHHPTKPEPLTLLDLTRKFQRLFWCLNTAAPHAGIAFDQYSERTPFIVKPRYESFEARGVIDRDGDCDALMKSIEPVELFLTQNIIGQENIDNSRICHNLSLAKLLAGNPHSTRFKLTARKERQFMRFDVRAKLYANRIGMSLRFLDVGLNTININQNSRRIDFVDSFRPCHWSVSHPSPISHLGASADRLS
ncbi:hypothetical protein D3C80_743960 [compost metagenome]